MNMEQFQEYVTKSLAEDLVLALRCRVLNSEGKYQSHDWSDAHKKWKWVKWRPRRQIWRTCVRCKLEVRKLR